MQHAAAQLLNRFGHQSRAGTECTGGLASTFPVRHPDPVVFIQLNDAGGVCIADTRQQQVREPGVQFVLRAGPGDHFRQPAECLDAAIGIVEPHLLQLLPRKGEFLQRLLRRRRCRILQGDQHEAGLPNGETAVGEQVEVMVFGTIMEDRVGGGCFPADFHQRVVDAQSGVLTRQVWFPGDRQVGVGTPSQQVRLAGRKRLSPSLSRLRPLSDQLQHRLDSWTSTGGRRARVSERRVAADTTARPGGC